MKIVVISPNKKSLEDIGRFLASENGEREVSLFAGGITKLSPVAEEQQPDLIILDSMCVDMEELAVMERLSLKHPGMSFMMLCSNHTPEFLINAMRVGVREVLPSPVTRDALLAAVGRLEQKLGLAAGRGHKGKIIAFTPCKGGSGATFLAANLGYILSAQENKKVALLDCNLEFGDAVLFLNDHKPRVNLSDIALNIERLDASFLTTSMVNILPNYSVLAAPEDPGQAMEVHPEHVEELLNLAVQQFDYVILDLGRAFSATTIKALDHADLIFPVLQMTLPFIRDAKRIVTVFRSLGYSSEKIRLIVNRFQKGVEISLDDVERTVGMKIYKTVPNGYAAVAASVNQGIPVMKLARNNPVTKALLEFGEALVQEQRTGSGGWWNRLMQRA